MARHRAAGSGNPNQSSGRHNGDPLAQAGYPLGQARRVTSANNSIEDRPGNDPNVRNRRGGSR